MRRRVSGWLACAIIVLAACSSTSTNEAPASGGGAGGASCAGQGADCYGCCKKSLTQEQEGAYLWAVEQCVCSDAKPSACSADCCVDPLNGQACLQCTKANNDGCISSTCSGDCVAFLDCLSSCL